MRKKNQIIISIIIVLITIIVGYLIYQYILSNNEYKKNLDKVEENKIESDEPVGLKKYRERKGIKSPEEEIQEREAELQKEFNENLEKEVKMKLEEDELNSKPKLIR